MCTCEAQLSCHGEGLDAENWTWAITSRGIFRHRILYYSPFCLFSSLDFRVAPIIPIHLTPHCSPLHACTFCLLRRLLGQARYPAVESCARPVPGLRKWPQLFGQTLSMGVRYFSTDFGDYSQQLYPLSDVWKVCYVDLANSKPWFSRQIYWRTDYV
jgi:hypothetical protein